jgi:hypothetical protein
MDLFATPGGDDYACIYGVASYEESYAGTFCWKTFQDAGPGTAVVLRAKDTISHSGKNQLVTRRKLPDRRIGFEIAGCFCPLESFRFFAPVDPAGVMGPQRANHR